MALTTSIRSPADLANLVLSRLGHPMRVGNLFDGSDASKKILDTYSQTRDDLLRSLTPDFARRQDFLVLLKSAPVGGYVPPIVWNATTYPQIPFLYAYAYPDECVKFGNVRPAPIFVPEFDPKPYAFQIVNDDTEDDTQKEIVCNVSGALGTWTARVTDPTIMDPSFIEAFASELAERLTVALADPRLLQAERQDADRQAKEQMDIQG